MFPGASCIHCGYDLRGHRSERCPECGEAVDWQLAGKGRIPWVRRKELGRWRAFWQTEWMVWRRPGVLRGELGRRVDRRSARSFAWWNLALATVIATVMVTGALRVRMMEFGWVDFRAAQIDTLALVWRWPVAALWDGWWVVLQLLPAAAIGAWVAQGLLRWMLAVGVKERTRRRRVWRLAAFASAMWPLLAMLAGAAAVLQAMATGNIAFSENVQAWIEWARWTVMGLLAVTFLIGAWRIRAVLRGADFFRWLATVVAYGVVTPVALLTVALVVFWVVGYLAMMVWSVVS